MQRELLATLELYRPAIHHAGSNFAPSRVYHYRNVGLYRLGHATDFRQSLIMCLEIAMGQIQPRDVHTRDDHFAKRILIIAGRTNSGDYLGLSESVPRSQRCFSPMSIAVGVCRRKPSPIAQLSGSQPPVFRVHLQVPLDQ